ncbi:hypothetical protein A4A49_19460 [Nicotiana attenuata]|uniref:Uncharacterized protein n=1 Tax=Nicotiana attenuata TaxID=49451 RepID=A0A314L9M2_NICAT|nr:hypothetical protein A4A49_19460 [Nicotiana attenuata]
MALKASGAYKQGTPCSTLPPLTLWKNGTQNDTLDSTSSDKFWWSHKRTGSSSSSSTTGRKEPDARERGIEQGNYAGVGIASDQRVEPVVIFEESELKSGWVRLSRSC